MSTEGAIGTQPAKEGCAEASASSRPFDLPAAPTMSLTPMSKPVGMLVKKFVTR